MGFWFFMLLMVMLLPLLMIFLGKYFIKKAPGKINELFGYRTSRSMKNEDTWCFAHNYIGKIWYKWGIALAIASGVIMLFLLGKGEDETGKVGSVITMLQLAPLLASIALTERALKKNFDKDGKRKNGKSE